MLFWYVLSFRAVPISSLNKPHPCLKNDGHLNFIAGWVQCKADDWPFPKVPKSQTHFVFCHEEVLHIQAWGSARKRTLPFPTRSQQRPKQAALFPWLGDRCLQAANFFFHGLVTDVTVGIVWYSVTSHHQRGRSDILLRLQIYFCGQAWKTPWKQKEAGVVTCSCAHGNLPVFPILCQKNSLFLQLFLGCEIS